MRKLKKTQLHLVEPEFHKTVQEAWERGEDVPFSITYLAKRQPNAREIEYAKRLSVTLCSRPLVSLSDEKPTLLPREVTHLAYCDLEIGQATTTIGIDLPADLCFLKTVDGREFLKERLVANARSSVDCWIRMA